MTSFRTFRVGGLRFIQIGQFSASFCITRKRPALFTSGRSLLGGFIATLATVAMFFPI